MTQPDTIVVTPDQQDTVPPFGAEVWTAQKRVTVTGNSLDEVLEKIKLYWE